ncbi:MAG: Gfo/Idh/MocA family oxidoreductase [Silicimonas sp.]
MNRKGLAVIGLGMALKPHAKALTELQDVYRVIAAYSRSAERRDAAATQYGFPTTGDLDALVADPTVDAALILTPPDSHKELATRFIDAGKHVLLEKPIDVTSDRGAEIVALAEQKDRRLGVVLQHRFRNSSFALADLLLSGRLGRLCAANCTVPWWRPQTYYDEPGRGTLARDGGGVLMTQAIHTLDLFRSLVGGVERVSALTATTAIHRMECEDYVSAVVILEGGAVGNIMATTAAMPGRSDAIDLICENGVTRLDGGELTVHWLTGEVTHFAAETGLGGGADPMDFPADSHRELLRDFARCIDENREPTVSGREALRTQYLIDAIIRSAQTSSWENVHRA